MTAHLVSPDPAPATAGVTDEWLHSDLPAVFAGAYRWLAPAQRDISAALIAAADIRPGFRVLDIATGSGIPALDVARHVGPDGHVSATDPAPVCVEAVAANAREAGLTNVDAVRCSAAGLPFPADSFDAVTCSMGVMFFEDMPASLAGIRRVLKPGKRAAFAAWGPLEENTMIGTMRAVAARHLPPPPPIAGDPKDVTFPMRFAQAGTLSAVLRTAGFEDVQEERPVLSPVWPDTPESQAAFWLRLLEASGPIAPDVRETLAADFVEALEPISREDGIHFSARIVIASGRTPA